MQVSREELTHEPLELELLDHERKDVLDRLHGHLFVVAPVGDAHEKPSAERVSLLNGDGMVYRVDLSREDGHVRAHVTTRMIKPACYWADQALAPRGPWAGKKIDPFFNMGIARVAPQLGFRDFGNTALVPMFDEKTDTARLLVTYDAGRPLEIDPVELSTLTPVGSNAEWQSELNSEGMPFKLVLSTAHPIWDAATGELFTVNYVRSIANLLGLVGTTSAAVFARAPRAAHSLLGKALDLVESSPAALAALSFAVHGVGKRAYRAAQAVVPGLPKDQVKLTRWDGKGALEQWDVVLQGRCGTQKPLRINDSMHQVAVTRDYVLLADTNFKVGLNQWMYNPETTHPDWDRLVRLVLGRRQLGEMPLYIVSRKDLTADRTTVVAREVTLPYGAVHFLADYENPDGKITIHAGHGTALDIAEWVRSYDVPPFGATGTPQGWMSGMLTGSVDLNRLGRYVVDAETGEVSDQQVLTDEKTLWSLGLYAADGVPAWNKLPDRIRDVYWFSSGFRGEMLTRYLVNLYKGYSARLVPMQQVQALFEENDGRSSLFRVDTGSMTIKDCYTFQTSAMLSSPQVIPAKAGDPRGDLLLVTEFQGDHASTFLIFEAKDLARGPVARLSSPKLRFGMSLHTAWLPKLSPSTAGYRVNPREDFGPAIEQNPLLREFFEQAVYPHVAAPPAQPAAPGKRVA
jgi:carotenoid cleavage dioxygenase-like enzyme